MGREHGTSVQPWGTLEDLLLACAVIRHGTASWDSIAMELQNRSSSSSSSAATAATATAMLGITPLYCRDKFDDLKRRFMARNDDESGRIAEELRRIRVEELKREVRRRDDSIVSLELKLKRLKEERDRSLKEEAENVDLKKDLEGDAGETTPLPENLAVSGDISDDKENRSFNESNSTTQKGEGQARNDAVKVQIRPEPERNEPDPGRTESSPVLNGKVDANENEIQDDDDDAGEKRKLVGGIMVKPSRAGRLSESNEGLESVGESKREKETASKQSSDVQSSASLSRKKRRRKVSSSGGGSSSGEEPEVDEVSPATKRVSAVKSEPLIKLLGIIRSHRLGSVFERRLRSQESERYKNLIRQHMDLRTVQSRLDRGVYADNIHKFFRDLLLIFNNGVMFFRKSSPEHVAAQDLRALVRRELRNKLRKPQPQPRKTVKLEPKHEPDSLSKPNNKPSTATLVACGKRSSMKVLTEGANRKEDKRERVAVGEKPNVINQKKNEGTFIKVSGEEKQGIRRKRTRERQGRRSRRTNNNKGGGEIKHEFGGNVLSSHDALELIKLEKKKQNAVKKKKQGAASFLKRMKQNSPSDQVTEDTDDVSEDDSIESKGEEEEEEEEKKRRGRKNEGRGERVTRSSTGGRGTKEENAKAKRGVGRPPKRPETVTVAAASGKRGRDNSESEVVGSASSRSRKRPRR
ncbi:uncharacterized protein LOC115977577 [Quercus lobata]|uniref:Bromo domain-containing protein n=1 Tax=Quercus lobata TaxID=97700 RepID=A0A7N2KLG7_QUELO|nr:uncharacterized protein LOC115977577 [Quercus lobata]